MGEEQSGELFKLRSVALRGAVPEFKHHIESALEAAWTRIIDTESSSKLKRLQNGVRIEVIIREVSNCLLATSDEAVFCYKYTIAINGQDPVAHGLSEPDVEDFASVFNSMPNVEFCASNAFRALRFYVKCSAENLDAKLNDLIYMSWVQLNDPNEMSQRGVSMASVVGKSKLERGLFGWVNETVCRVLFAWSIENFEPNMAQFTLPSTGLLSSMLSKANIQVYNEPSYLRLRFSMKSDMKNISQLLEKAVVNAWHSENQMMPTNKILVSIEEDQLTKPQSEEFKAIEVFVGVESIAFDIKDLKQPSSEALQRSIRSFVPDSQFRQVDETLQTSDGSVSSFLAFSSFYKQQKEITFF